MLVIVTLVALEIMLSLMKGWVLLRGKLLDDTPMIVGRSARSPGASSGTTIRTEPSAVCAVISGRSTHLGHKQTLQRRLPIAQDEFHGVDVALVKRAQQQAGMTDPPDHVYQGQSARR